MLFFPVALGQIVEVFSNFRFATLARRGALIVLISTIGLQGYVLFFHSWVSQYYGADKTQVLQEYFNTLDSRTTVFVYDIPEIPLFLPQGTQYYQYISINRGTNGLGADELPVIDKKIPDLLLVREIKKGSFPGYHETETVKGVVVMEPNP